MKKLLVIVIGLVLSINCFAQEDLKNIKDLQEWKDISISFSNQQGPRNAVMIIESNYPGNGHIIPWEWFFESSTWTRTVRGTVYWKLSGRIIGEQDFYQSINYIQAFQDDPYGEYITVNVGLDGIQYYQVPDFE